MERLDYLALLDRAYTASRAPGSTRQPVRGSALGDCPRKLAALLSGLEPAPLSARTLRIFELGTDRGVALASHLSSALDLEHDSTEREVWIPTAIAGEEGQRIVRALEARFGSTDPSVRVHDEQLQIRARIDLLIPLSDAQSVAVIEVKTKGSYGFKLLEKEGVEQAYSAQVLGQVLGLAREGLHVERATVLYEDKDTQALAALDVDVSAQALEDFRTGTLHEVEQVLRLAPWTEFERAPAVHVERALAGGVKALPWQCNYCSIGPARGKCAMGRTLVDDRKPGAEVPKWRIV